MNKKIAIFYTGEPRTIFKTIKYFKNIVLKNDNYHVFAVLQKTNNYQDIKKLIFDNFNNNLKKLEWFIKDDEEWIQKRDYIVNKIERMEDRWKNYIRDSGSIIEYYQMYLAYKNMENYEKENNIKYDYIFKIRCDNIITQSIHFDWIDYDKEFIKNYLYEIKNKFNIDSIINYKLISIFMNTIYHFNRLNSVENYTIANFKWVKPNYMMTDELKRILNINNEDDFLNEFYEYFKNEKYCFIFRTNNIYFMNRTHFHPIHILYENYAQIRFDDNEDHYWFNAESQFVKCLKINNIDVFDSCTQIEEKSLYEYNNQNYFNENEELKLNDPNILFFICRH